jgi:hypothetical protein
LATGRQYFVVKENDMARYIDADALLGNLKRQYGEELGWWCTVNMSDVGMMIEDAPTANVAPMEEVERLQTICDSYIVQYGTVAHKEVLLKKERADTAREIFEEIESISSDFPLYGNTNTVILSERDLAFIKKKYTEGL